MVYLVFKKNGYWEMISSTIEEANNWKSAHVFDNYMDAYDFFVICKNQRFSW